MSRKLINHIIFIFTAAFLLFSCSQFNSNIDEVLDFELTLMETVDHQNGEKLILSEYAGTPILINFWFPSCPPCIAEIPEINEFYLNNKPNVKVVGVQLVGFDSLQDGQDFLNNSKVAYASGADLDGSLIVKYKISGFPTTIFINRKGHIHQVWQGKITANKIDEIIKSMGN